MPVTIAMTMIDMIIKTTKRLIIIIIIIVGDDSLRIDVLHFVSRCAYLNEIMMTMTVMMTMMIMMTTMIMVMSMMIMRTRTSEDDYDEDDRAKIALITLCHATSSVQTSPNTHPLQSTAVSYSDGTLPAFFRLQSKHQPPSSPPPPNHNL